MSENHNRIVFTKEMKKDYTILLPNMLGVHFRLIANVFRNRGYNAVLLTNEGRAVVDEGLKYVHNDTCYPALLVIGQFINALKSGKYDVNKTALIITQTGGGCRASNYIHLLRKALRKAGFANVPVISLNLSGLERNSGFKLTLPFLYELIMCLTYGDLIMLLRNQVLPYEAEKGVCDDLSAKHVKMLTDKKNDAFSGKNLRKYMEIIAKDFKAVPKLDLKRAKVGVVGEIYVKFSSLANNHLEEYLISQDCEVMVPGIMSFILFKIDNRIDDVKLYDGSKVKKVVASMLFRYVERLEEMIHSVVKECGGFVVPAKYRDIKKLVDGVIGYGSKMGEGWLLTAEMVELVDSGYENIVCAQPFGCLPNHIVGRGMIGKIKSIRPNANIVPIDYDPGATRVNQENRIKLMLATAQKRRFGE